MPRKRKFTRMVIVVLAILAVLSCTLSYDANAAAIPQYAMQYNDLVRTVSGTYNCYGYAIGTNKNIDPGYYAGRTMSYADYARPSVIQGNVIADLVALGYSNVRAVSASYTLQPGEFMIAFTCGYWEYTGSVRMLENGEVNDPRMVEGNDYHFWRKDSANGSWYHKMGVSSAIMRLKSGYTPASIVVNDELYNNSGVAVAPHRTLPGASIYYIVYSTNVNRMP